MFQRVSYAPPPPAGSDSSSPPLPQLGTVLHHGPVPPTKGDWYGIEWDDPARGKHSGVHEKTGMRYFQTRVEGAGSFLRTDAKGLDTRGKTFKQALYAKYLDIDLSSSSPAPATAPPSTTGAGDEPQSQLYATESNFEVEVVLSKRVSDRFKQLSRLREVGLEWEAVSRAADEDGVEELRELGSELSRLEILNLSYSLLPTLQEADRIVAVLPRLRTLALNSDRFRPIESPLSLPGFQRLTSLQLNSTLMTWPELLNVSASFVDLADLQFGFNRLRSLRSSSSSRPPSPVLPKLERLNLEANELGDWEELVDELSMLPALNTLILTSNRISSLALPSSSSTHPKSAPALLQLRHLSLTSNLLSSWSTSIDALAASVPSAFPALTSLRLLDNPLFPSPVSSSADSSAPSPAGQPNPAHTRLLVLARLPQLTELEGTPVTPAEKEDAERFWVERVDKGEEKPEGEWAKARVEELRQKHGFGTASSATGQPAAAPSSAKPTLKDRLLHLDLRLPPSLPPPPPSKLPLSVLPTLRTLLLRAQISRLVGRPLPKTKYQLVAVLTGGEEGEVRVEIDAREEGKEVGWWGLQTGDAVEVVGIE
ncbi:hypothetical protein JCM8097_008024 [Rhodosporidiobolus ruineniae]